MKAKIISLSLVFLTSIYAMAAPPVEEGKAIFSTRCAGCHNVNKIVTGPALAGVNQRHSIDWIIKFVHSSQTVIKSGDEKAVALFEKFNKIPMPDHPDLTADNIKSIVEYVKSEAATGGGEKPPFARPGKLRPAYMPLSISNYGFFIVYLSAVAMLIMGLLFAVHVKGIERKMREEK
ncbi:MAG: c-type cytochrome [Flavisolibacter sp.]